MRIILVILSFAVPCLAYCQEPPPTNPSHKSLTPAQQDYQKQYRVFIDQRHALQAQAQRAYNDEMAREKNDPCNAESSTRGSEECLTREMNLTAGNYTAFTSAIRQLLAEKPPQIGPSPGPGPTGTPPSSDEQVKEFDDLQASWQRYRNAVPTVGYNQYKGGTLAPVFSGECGQMIIRSHMRELYMIYGGPVRL
jgi:hypothetical protein